MEGDRHTEIYCENDFSCEPKDSPAKNLDSETADQNSSSFNENTVVSENQEVSPTNGPTLPILQKIINLSNKIKELKEEHAFVSNQVKEITSCSFSDSELSKAIQLLNTELGILKKKYLEESFERKRLYNEVIELKGNIRVFCRCRPLNQAEIANGSTSVVEFDQSHENELQILSSDPSKKQFKFDHVFKPEDDQEAVFAQTKPIATSVLDGYNVCIFAYGQTGTGKTFTMEGTPENRGVNYRTLEELFRCSESRSHLMKFEIFVSMLEVYNEKIRDLLVENPNQPPKKLEVKQSAEGTQEVPGLVEAQVYKTDEVWELLKNGYRVRSVGSTAANELSSRSHCLLRVTVKGENLINGQRTRSHLWLVDLAGSERVGKIEVEGERLKESQFINKSLSALGDVISALASKTSHIPYRNSKLTHMLQNSLGGDCKTLMFVQISPSSTDLGETLCSLNFASRVRGIESGPARKQADVSELLKFKQMAEKVKHDEKETKKLQDSVQSLQLRLIAREHICKGLQEKVRDLESQLAEERKTRIKQETRAFATASSSKHQTEKLPSIAEKKPPLAPTRTRMPLRRITNFMPHSSPVPAKKQTASSTRYSLATTTYHNKENNSLKPASDVRTLMKPRRSSIAVRPSQPSAISSGKMAMQPRRRVSIATLRPEPSSYMNMNMTTPLRPPSSSNLNNGIIRGGPRKARYSKLFSPMPEFRTSSSSDHLSTPNYASNKRSGISNSSSKFMRSPPGSGGGGWKPSHPTVIALQKRTVVWSPLKMKTMKNRRPSFLPAIRPSSSSSAAAASDILRREQ
ncbi:PREDICTED: kinesin-like protein KIN-14G [Tarenaya hassleriana]|uniref:kinesin-like protein KIN-14G n=1 Tax=Tarenaya hassleriana TaxID=28532 RepID=UPI00053C6099|nr:PREDICTED: kinesin-like protein KIN-14G [Tarenaya hassleriana]